MIVKIICRDCTKPCQTIYHVIGLQCLNCLGFNAIRSDDKLYASVNDERKFLKIMHAIQILKPIIIHFSDRNDLKIS